MRGDSNLLFAGEPDPEKDFSPQTFIGVQQSFSDPLWFWRGIDERSGKSSEIMHKVYDSIVSDQGICGMVSCVVDIFLDRLPVAGFTQWAGII